MPIKPSWSVAVAVISVWPGAPAVIVAWPLASSVTGWPLNVTTRLLIGATLLAMALIIDLLAGDRREAGRQHDRHARQLWLHGRVDEDVLRRRRLSVGDLQRDDVVARLRRPGRPLELAGLRVDRGAGRQVDRPSR